MIGVSGWWRLIISATASAPWAWGSQWRSMPKAAGLSALTAASGSKFWSLSIRTARFTMRTRRPLRSRYSAIVVKPMGYISNTGVEGTRSLTGP